MSVLNQMLRDLEKRGAMPAVVAAAGTATVARPALAQPPRPVNARRRWIWAGVLAVAAAFVGIHSWLSYRVQQAAVLPAPLGARQFAAVVAPQSTTAPSAPLPPATPVPAPVASISAPAPTMPAPAPVTSSTLPKPTTAAERPRRATVAPRPQAAAQSGAKEAPLTPPAAFTDASQAVTRSNSDTNRDVDRAADLIARGRSTEAMDLLVQVLDRQPTNGTARSSLAALLAEAGRREQALHVLLSGSDVDPGRFAVPAAQLQAEMGDLQGALRTLARVPLARRSAGFEALHAGLAQRAGDHMSAIASYKRALAQPQPDPVWWVGLGVSLEATGEPAEARNAYAHATAEARLPADVRGYVADRVAALDSQARRAANVF